ncbi:MULTISPECIES: acyl transferase [unclassified Spirosoma]|uniref:LuxE/PaaK family acyltransferase n=1 Tax=unclassified Spirosoma TaxID=2621999 RepID=UPI00096979B3|nr:MULTISPECIES: acyl transferase [unclassified Spirosoma]OJW79771.1 MAG: acyl transferase [Spirosoma sp. 48-14]
MSFSLTLSAAATPVREVLRQQVIAISSILPTPATFESLALAVFRYQAVHNPVYRAYLTHLNCHPERVDNLRQVPFMPIGFFKTHTVLTGIDTTTPAHFDTTLTFASSGTTGEQTSRHVVPDSALYQAVSTRIFEQIYGPLHDFHILALLPSYLERNNSSLVYMVQQFMAQTGQLQRTALQVEPSGSGFYLHNHAELTEQLKRLVQHDDGKKILLIGVTFGLLDWAESASDLTSLGQSPRLIVMETGGMKGRRRELLREEVHEILMEKLGLSTVHSEYGMTELLSQAYSMGNGVFKAGPTMRLVLRDINDPFCLYPDDYPRTGGINVVDLANLDSCSFIETQDLGQYAGADGAFRVIGRFDNSDVRGCNLMIE